MASRRDGAAAPGVSRSGGTRTPPLKILVLTNLYPPHHIGGYELICRAVVDNLAVRGHDLHVLTSDHRREHRSWEPERNVRRFLKINGFYGHPWLPMWRLVGLERHNNRVLREVIAALRPELIYIWAMGGLSKSLLFTVQASGLPMVFHVSDHWIAQGLPIDVWLNWWNEDRTDWRRLWIRKTLTLIGARRLFQRWAPTNPVSELGFPRLFFCSRFLRESTARSGFEVMHGRVIPSPVDVRTFDGDPRGEDEPPSRWLWAGRLSPDKGLLTALEALALLGDQFRGHLDVYGGGEDAYVRQLRAFAREHELAVSFRSAEPAEMSPVYRVHDALLFTSEWDEPFARTPLEAMASGLPVIATTTGGSPELFRHGDNALTYTPGSPRELADRIRELTRNGALRARIAATGRAEVRAKYAENVIVDQIEGYLTETLRVWRPQAVLTYST